MRAIDRLKRDHQLLSTKFALIESALRMGPGSWFVLREMCFSLACQLTDHIRREERVLARCRAVLPSGAREAAALAHRDEPEHLRAINGMFLGPEGSQFSRIEAALLTTIRGLREHMAEEERDLFPAVERFVGAEGRQETVPAVGETDALEETMSVNRVLREHPETQPVFDRLFINVPYEGCHCLDEVAWRHGMDSRELINQLERRRA